jgi:hypothetical protein
MPLIERNFLIFQTDLFLYHQPDEHLDRWCVGGDCAGWFYMRLLLDHRIRDDCDPAMGDWGGWTFAVRVDDVRVRTNVWPFLDLENCWLFGLKQHGGWFRRRSAAWQTEKELVADAIESIIAADSRLIKRSWYAQNPFDRKLDDI